MGCTSSKPLDDDPSPNRLVDTFSHSTAATWTTAASTLSAGDMSPCKTTFPPCGPFLEFEPCGTIPASSIEWARARGTPPGLLRVMSTCGTGFIGASGLLRTVDPVHYAATVPFLFKQHELVVPFLTTGLGDMFVWHRCGLDDPAGTIRHLLPRYGALTVTYAGDDESLDAFWRAIQCVDGDEYGYEEGDEDMLDDATYRAGMEMGAGKPGINESLTHIPLCVLRKDRDKHATKDPSTLDRGALCVALGMFGQVAGKVDLFESIATAPWDWQPDRGWGPIN